MNSYKSPSLTVIMNVEVLPKTALYDSEVEATIESIEPKCPEDDSCIGVMCDSCFLEELCSCVGTIPFLFGEEKTFEESCHLKVVGRIDAWSVYDANNGDYDGEERFVIESIEVLA